MKNKNHMPYGFFTALGEFFIILSAVFVGKFFNKDFILLPDWSFFLISIFSLVLGIILRYLGEKCKNDETLPWKR